MMVLAALPGIVRVLLATGKLVKPGNSRVTINFLGSRIQKVGLGITLVVPWGQPRPPVERPPHPPFGHLLPAGSDFSGGVDLTDSKPVSWESSWCSNGLSN